MDHKINGVLFDLDGTLLDTLQDLASAVNTVLRGHGLPEHPLAAYRHFVGDGVDLLLRRALSPSDSDEALLSECIMEFQREYDACWNRTTAPYEGIEELLEELETKNLPLAILSNKPHEATTGIVQHFFGRFHFNACIGGGIFPRKPDPEAAFYIARVMGIEPAGCLYVGDTGTDMKTARAAGMPSAGVLWGFREVGELRNNGACWIVNHPRDILEIVDNG